MTPTSPTKQKSHHLAQAMLKAIRTGDLPVTLPGENQLAMRYGVSRSTVRCALSLLRQDGVLVSRQGSHSRIIDASLRKLRILWVDQFTIEAMPVARRRLFEPFDQLLRSHGAAMDFIQLPFGKDQPRVEAWLLEHLLDYDGIVVSCIDGNIISPALNARFCQHGNVVAVDRNQNNLADVVVDMDNTQAGYEAARLLDTYGIRRTALVGISTGLRSNRFHERVDGFINYWLDHAESAVMPIVMLSSNRVDFNSPERLLRKVLACQPQVEAFFCVTDLLAWKCIDALHAMGIRVPQDISVVGYDNVDLGSETSLLPLTTIAPPLDVIRDILWKTLVKNTGSPPTRQPGDPAQMVLLPPEVIKRNSVRNHL